MSGNPLATPGQAEIRPTYRPDIDGLRAVAIISVVLYHASESLVPGGFIGVDVFFVISGYLISSLIFKELDQGHFRFGDFYVRRIRRIFPALILMMGAVWIAANFLFTKNEFVQLGQYIFAGGAFFSNLLQWRVAGYFDTDAALKPLQHLWSLGIEEQFYIVWPVAVVLLWRRRLPLWIAAAMALSFAFNIWRTPYHATGAFFLPFGRAWELLLGSLLAWEEYQGGHAWFDRERKIPMLRPVALKNIAAWAALALLAAGFIFIHSDSAFPGWWVLLPTSAAFLFIWAGETAWPNTRLLANPVMVFIGLISYPLYIWHWPLLSLARILGNAEPSPLAKSAIVAASVLLAILTYLLVERPLRRARLSRGVIVGALASAMVVLCTLGSLSYLHIIQSPRMAADAAAEEAARTAWNATYDCRSFLSPKAQSFEFCRIWGDPTLKKTFVIWGDSHAHSWSAAAATLAKERGARLVEISHGACPPLVGIRRITKNLGKVCDDFTFLYGVLGQIERLKPDEIIVAARWSFYIYPWPRLGAENIFVTSKSDGGADSDTARIAYETQIPETLGRLAKIGKVLVIKTVPNLHSSIEIGLARDPNGYEPTLAEYRAFEALPNDVIDKAARAIPGVTALDPAAVLCDPKKCHAVVKGVRVYEDDTHLTDAGALLFMPTLRRLVQ